MEISKHLAQFTGEKILLVAAGQTRAVFYRIGDALIDKTGELEEEKPKYSDREGFFGKQGKGRGRPGMEVSGSVYENKKDHVEAKFVKALVQRLRDEFAAWHPEKAYIILPENMAGPVEEKLPGDLKNLTILIRAGNLTDAHSFELIKIAGEWEKGLKGSKVPRKKEAGKLLDKRDPEKL